MTDEFNTILHNIIDKIVLTKIFTVPGKHVIREPQITNGLIISLIKCDKLYKTSRGLPLSDKRVLTIKNLKNIYKD